MSLNSNNRRKESRYRSSAGTRLAWRTEASARARRKGWTLDQSSNGIGFLVEKPRLPQPGETIAVRPAPGADPLHYEVVRVTPLPGKLAVVGGERIYGKTAETALPEPAWSNAAQKHMTLEAA